MNPYFCSVFVQNDVLKKNMKKKLKEFSNFREGKFQHKDGKESGNLVFGKGSDLFNSHLPDRFQDQACYFWLLKDLKAYCLG